jgi:hypothetical protein
MEENVMRVQGCIRFDDSGFHQKLYIKFSEFLTMTHNLLHYLLMTYHRIYFRRSKVVVKPTICEIHPSIR